MTQVEEHWGDQGLVLRFRASLPGTAGARVVRRPQPLLPPARGAFPGGHLRVAVDRPDTVTEIVFEDRRCADEVRGQLLVHDDSSDEVTATPRAGALAEVARASWWFQWCPTAVPQGVLLADLAVTRWRAGLKLTAFEALADGGAAALIAWLREVSDLGLPDRLLELLRQAGRDAVEALGTASPEGRQLAELLGLLDSVAAVPASVSQFEGLWDEWEAREAPSATRGLALSLGAGAALPTILALVAGTGSSRSRSGRRPVAATTSVDWHAVPPRVLLPEEGTIGSVADLDRGRLTITVASATHPASHVKGLLAQMIHRETGDPAGSAMGLVPGEDAVSLRADGPLPAEVRDAPTQYIPSVRHSTYFGPLRAGRAAAAARAQRFAVRAFAVERTQDTRTWLGLADRPELRHRLRLMTNASTLALTEAYAPGEEVISLVGLSDTAPGDAAEDGLPLGWSGTAPLLSEVFMALAADR